MKSLRALSLPGPATRRDPFPSLPRTAAVLLLLLSPLALTACSNGGSSDSGGSPPAPVQEISIGLDLATALPGVPVDAVQARLAIDGGTPLALDLNADHTATARLNAVPAGTHQLEVTYFLTQQGRDLDLARASLDADILADGVTHVGLGAADLDTDIDADRDGHSNLAEYLAGTNAFDKFRVPGGRSPWYAVGQGTMQSATSASYRIEHGVGITVAGTVTSPGHVLRSGFDLAGD